MSLGSLRPLLLLRSLCSSSSSLAGDVNAICRVLSDHRSPHHDLSSALAPFASSLAAAPPLLDAVLKRCRHLPSPSHRLFLFASSLPSFSPSPLSHRLLLQTLSSHRLFPLAWAHISDIHHNQHPSSSSTLSPHLFRILFFAYSDAGLPSDAVRAFHKMPDFDLIPTLDDLHLLLYALCRRGHVSEARHFFHAAKSGFDVTQKTYTILMQGCARAGQPKDALHLFDEMCERDSRACKADVAAYNALLAALCEGGEVEEAGRRLKVMREVRGLEPDAASYGVFVRAYCEAEDSRSALRMVESMRRKRLEPNVFTYNCVIRLLCEKEENGEEAYKLLDEMVEGGVRPDVWSYNRILALHCKLREVNMALRLVKRMDEDGCSPDKHTYNMLMKMLLGVGRIDRAEEVWDGMEERGFYPSASSYAVMIHGLCRKRGRMEEACRYFELMVEEGIPPYVSTCTLLRGELLRLGFRERVDVLTDRMRRSTSCTIQELSSVMESGKEIEKAVRIAPFSNRLAHSVPSHMQGLRCLTNFEALRFSEPIRLLAENMVERMVKNSSMNGGKYISVHLRFEEDMVAFSCCTYDGGDKEKHEMDNARERSWRGKFRRPGRKISPETNRMGGKCPLTPLEVGMMLRGMGFDNSTSVYVASGKIYNAEKYMAPLHQLFPLLETKETLASADELAPFKDYTSRLAALDYTVCAHSEVFVTTQGGNFPHFLMGHRRYLYEGHTKTIKPDKKKLVLSFDNPNIRWEKFKRNMQEVLHQSDMKGIALRKADASLYTFPMPDCMCQQQTES